MSVVLQAEVTAAKMANAIKKLTAETVDRVPEVP